MDRYTRTWSMQYTQEYNHTTSYTPNRSERPSKAIARWALRWSLDSVCVFVRVYESGGPGGWRKQESCMGMQRNECSHPDPGPCHLKHADLNGVKIAKHHQFNNDLHEYHTDIKKAPIPTGPDGMRLSQVRAASKTKSSRSPSLSPARST